MKLTIDKRKYNETKIICLVLNRHLSVEVSGAAGRHIVRHLVEKVVELLQRQGIVQGLKRSNWRRSKDSCCLEKRDGVKSEMDVGSLSGNSESRSGGGVCLRRS